MRNQMGNNNVSGLQEEEKSSAVEGQEKFSQEVVHEDDVKGETHMACEADEKDFHEIVKELSPDDHRSRAKDSHIQNETLDVKEKESKDKVSKEDLVAQTTEIGNTGEEQEEDLVSQTTQREDAAELLLEELVAQSDNPQAEGSYKQEQVINVFNHLVESLEVPTESSGEASEINESQTATSSKLFTDNEKPLEPTLEGHSFGTSEPQIQQQLSFEREIEEIEGSNSVFNANFTSDDVDPKADDQHDVVRSQDEPLGEDLSAIVRAGELLELNLLDHNGDKVPLRDNTTAENLDVTVISGTNNQAMEKEVNDAVKEGKASQEDKFLETVSVDEEKLELLWVDEDENGSITREMEPVFFSGLGDKGEKSVDSSQDVSEPQDKSIVLTEESKPMGMESENGEDNCDSSQIQLSELKSDESIAPQPEKVKTGFDCERNGKENAESISSPEIENAYEIEVGTTSSDNNVDSVSMKHEVVKENVPKIRTVLTALTVIEPNEKQENSSEGGSGRISTESNEETTSNQVELRKSPSFDFDLSLGARYEDSDQTPLLCHDKAASRSISSRDVLTFQTTTVKNHYGRDQLPYEAVEVEEKTIRMERSDSDHKPRAPFMSLLKKEGTANAFVELKQEEAPLTEQAIVNSTKGSGRRRPRVSIFSTCICCAASIP